MESIYLNEINYLVYFIQRAVATGGTTVLNRKVTLSDSMEHKVCLWRSHQTEVSQRTFAKLKSCDIYICGKAIPFTCCSLNLPLDPFLLFSFCLRQEDLGRMVFVLTQSCSAKTGLNGSSGPTPMFFFILFTCTRMEASHPKGHGPFQNCLMFRLYLLSEASIA